MLNTNEQNQIKKAAQHIEQGGVVVMPTETVYGLAANAFDERAVAKIFALKGRPSHNPLIVHVPSTEKAKEIADFNERANLLAREFWPGPLTIVLPKKERAKIASNVTAGLDSIALRVPYHEIARGLLEECGVPLAAPSANKSGKLSPTNTDHCIAEFNDEDIFVLEGKKSAYGLESTIIDLSTEIPTILRYGFITPEAVEKVLCEKVAFAKKDSKVKAPGMLLRHYAPRVRLRMDATSIAENEVGLEFGNIQLENRYGNKCLNLSENGDLAEAASNLFAFLHQLDGYAVQHGIEAVSVAPIPDEGIGLAINDRLKRGATSYGNRT